MEIDQSVNVVTSYDPASLGTAIMEITQLYANVIYIFMNKPGNFAAFHTVTDSLKLIQQLQT